MEEEKSISVNADGENNKNSDSAIKTFRNAETNSIAKFYTKIADYRSNRTAAVQRK